MRSDLRALAYAVPLVSHICAIAGDTSLIETESPETDDLTRAIARDDVSEIFGWLLEQFSFQGVSDASARTYQAAHRNPTWRAISRSLGNVECSKLASYWRFYSCGYQKTKDRCNAPQHIHNCPLPSLELRNGRLDQLAYSLFFFMRDIAEEKFVGWMNRQLSTNSSPDALLEPLRCINGVSDKVISMALSTFLLRGAEMNGGWGRVGADMIAVDSLVHGFLQRSGILARFGQSHLYGPRCYRDDGCAGVIRSIARCIDARKFNPKYPRYFPRFVQHGLWRFCSLDALNVCNGNRIDDRRRCRNNACALFDRCDRLKLIKTAA